MVIIRFCLIQFEMPLSSVRPGDVLVRAEAAVLAAAATSEAFLRPTFLPCPEALLQALEGLGEGLLRLEDRRLVRHHELQVDVQVFVLYENWGFRKWKIAKSQKTYEVYPRLHER